MSVDAILDALVGPRPNGSPGLARAAAYLADLLRAHGAEVERFAFRGTPYGFRLVWLAALGLMLAWAALLVRRRFALALVPPLLAAGLLLAEFEALRSPVSGLLGAEQHEVVATFPAAPGASPAPEAPGAAPTTDTGPLLIFSAHLDTTTHFGDHYDWGRWGWRLGPATGAALGLPLLGLALRRRGRGPPRWLLVAAAAGVLLPFAAMTWFHAAGPLLRTPSPGAVDNAGSVAALALLAGHLDARPADAPTEVRLVFTTAEEERALGSWAYARELVRREGRRPMAAVNLEGIGASDSLALVTEDGFELRRFESPLPLVRRVAAVAYAARGEPLGALALPGGVLTDGRSFLAHGIPAVTLRATVDGGFPHGLHSARDARERLQPRAIERAALLLAALVADFDLRGAGDAARPPASGTP